MKNLLIAIALGLATSSAWADVIYVAPAETPGFASAEAATVAELVKSAVHKNGHSLASKAAGADFELHPKLMKLGSAIIFSMSKWKGGEQKFETSLKAPSVEELDNVSSRVTRAAIQEVDVYSDRTVDDVAADEEHQGNRRKQTLYGHSFGLGPVWAQNLGYTSAMFDFMYSWRWAMSSFTIRPTLEFGIHPSTDETALFFSGTIGGSYYFAKGDLSPFVGLDFGLGFSKAGGNGAFSDFRGGFLFGGGVGVAFMRTASTGLELYLHSNYLANANSYGNPYTLALLLSVSW